MSILDSKLSAALAAVAPRMRAADVAAWRNVLMPAMDAEEINTSRRAASFLGQISVESAALTAVTENLNYSAAALLGQWPSHFESDDIANAYARQPERIANRAYANRLGNGDEASGDGWRYRGRGLIQLTGKDAYTRFAASIGRSLADTVAFLETREGAAASATWFWTSRKLNALADLWALTTTTRAINGGTNALAQRIQLSNAALRALS